MRVKFKISVFALALAVGSVFAGLGAFLCAGPRLGPLYDFLLETRRRLYPASPSPEILLLEMDSSRGEALTASEAAQVILAVTELNGTTLLMETPVLNFTQNGEQTRDNSLETQFEDEFDSIKRSAENFFDAIRLGYISPQESGAWLERLYEICDTGKNKLLTLSLSSGEDERKILEAASRASTGVWLSADSSFGTPLFTARASGYSKTLPDKDGVLRRIAPQRADGDSVSEHIAWVALKSRFEATGVERGRDGLTLSLRSGGGERTFHLDENASLIIEKPSSAFRRLSVSNFLQAASLENEIYALLTDDTIRENLPRYSGFTDEDYPAWQYEAALSARQTLFEAVSPEENEAGTTESAVNLTALRDVWRSERVKYYTSLARFFTDETSAKIKAAITAEISKNPGEAKLAELSAIRDELFAAFNTGRTLYNTLLPLRQTLVRQVPASFCVLGGEDSLPSAYLANSLLTGAAIQPEPEWRLLFFALLAVLLISLLCAVLPAAFFTLSGLLLTGAAFAFLCRGFVTEAVWLDPVAASAPVLLAAIGACIFELARCALVRKRISRVFDTRFPQAMIRRLSKADFKPEKALAPGEAGTVSFASILAIKRVPGLHDMGPASVSESEAECARKIAALLRENGALVVCVENDFAAGIFGSSPERAALGPLISEPEYNASLVSKAASCARKGASSADFGPDYRFAIDASLCACCWTPETGITVSAEALSRVRVIANLASRVEERILVSKTASRLLPKEEVKPITTDSPIHRAANLVFAVSETG